MQKVIIFFGTRPEAIKLAPVVTALLGCRHFKTLVCSTGQHKEMLQQVVDFFNIPVHISLAIMEHDQQLAGLTAKLLVSINEVLLREQPDLIIVQGDTTTTFAASLAAFYNKIKIAHIEAGLRTFNKFSPFPEETNRYITSRITDLHFPPTEVGRSNLLKEGVSPARIIVTGNTGIDALFLGLRKIEGVVPAGISACRLQEVRHFLLATIHRRENQGEGIRNVVRAIKRIAENANIPVIFPVHLNPNIKDDVQEILGGHPLIRLTSPLSYPDFLWLMKNARVILTDSNGVQEEAPSLGKPVILLRDTTECPEVVEAGSTVVVGCDEARIYETTMRLLTDNDVYDAMATTYNPYGDGFAADRILECLLSRQMEPAESEIIPTFDLCLPTN